MQRGVQLVHLLARETDGRRCRRRRRFRLGRALHRALVPIDLRHRRTHHRRLRAVGGIVLAIAQIATDQRSKPTAQSAVFGERIGRRRGILELFLFARAVRRLRRALLPHRLHEFDALLAQDALHAADGVTLAVEQMADATQQLDVIRPIIATAAAPLHRIDIAEARLPETQYVLRQIELVRNLADGTKCVGRLAIQSDTSLVLELDALLEQTAQDAGACSSPPPFMRCLRIADGLNTITRRGEMGTSLPVLGLRPIRCPFLRTTNDPKEDSFTVSPRSRQSVISFSTISTRVADSVRDNPTFWYTASHRSARVTVLPAIARPRSRRPPYQLE